MNAIKEILVGLGLGSMLAVAIITASPASPLADDMGTCLSDTSAEWRPCQFDPALPIMEDDPRWDCATMGNRICG